MNATEFYEYTENSTQFTGSGVTGPSNPEGCRLSPLVQTRSKSLSTVGLFFSANTYAGRVFNTGGGNGRTPYHGKPGYDESLLDLFFRQRRTSNHT